ncbi:MAG: phosphoribosylanthranilate isomerase [Pseudorhodoplanes sp.]
MSLLVKICGLRSAEAVDAALEAGADMLGFVFFPASPRHVDFETARTLADRVGARAQKVALSVDAGDDDLARVVEALRPDLLQLHGSETPERVAALRARLGVPVMKVLPIAEAADLSSIPLYRPVADRLLFDAKPPRGATRPGGLGKSFDWSILSHADPGLPYMLSGGLDAANVANALRITGAPGVDVSSGVERASGEKDADKIRAFVKAARAAERDSKFAVSPA